MKELIISAVMVAALAGVVQAEEITCKGSITSVQGEGLVARTHRFEVTEVSGNDLATVIQKCSKIAREMQNRAARKNPGGNFRRFSDLALECVQGSEKVSVRRTIQTEP